MKHTSFILLLVLSFVSCLKLEQEEIAIINEGEIPIENKLPQVYIETNGAAIPDEPKIKAEILIENKGEKNYEGLIFSSYGKSFGSSPPGGAILDKPSIFDGFFFFYKVLKRLQLGIMIKPVIQLFC